MVGDYISREAALTVMERLRDKCGNDEMAFALNWASGLLRNVPAADVVEVVRCRDCRNRDPEDKKCDSGALERAGCVLPWTMITIVLTVSARTEGRTVYDFDFSLPTIHAYRGERHVHAKLSYHDVQDIKARYSAGQATQTRLAKEYGVSRNAIHRIVTGATWGNGGQDE